MRGTWDVGMIVGTVCLSGERNFPGFVKKRQCLRALVKERVHPCGIKSITGRVLKVGAGCLAQIFHAEFARYWITRDPSPATRYCGGAAIHRSLLKHHHRKPFDGCGHGRSKTACAAAYNDDISYFFLKHRLVPNC